MDWREILTCLLNKRKARLADLDLITQGGYLGDIDPLDEIIEQGANEILDREYEEMIQRMREDYYGSKS